MYDITGRIVKSGELVKETQVIDVSDLPAGVYDLAVKSSESVGMIKLIKQ